MGRVAGLGRGPGRRDRRKDPLRPEVSAALNPGAAGAVDRDSLPSPGPAAWRLERAVRDEAASYKACPVLGRRDIHVTS